MAELADADLDRISQTVQGNLRDRDVNFGSSEGSHPFHVDAIPRVLEAAEWNGLAFGMVQRARALNRFIRDVYGDRDIVKSGRVPERVITSAHHFEPELVGLDAPGGHAPVIGFDLVRGADGRFGVLEENLRTPSGLSYSDAGPGSGGRGGAVPPARRQARAGPELRVPRPGDPRRGSRRGRRPERRTALGRPVQLRLVRAQDALGAARHPDRDGRRARGSGGTALCDPRGQGAPRDPGRVPANRRGPLPRRAGRPHLDRRSAAGAAARGQHRGRQRAGRRHRRRQADPGLRQRDDPLLPRPGADPARGEDLRPRRT